MFTKKPKGAANNKVAPLFSVDFYFVDYLSVDTMGVPDPYIFEIVIRSNEGDCLTVETGYIILSKTEKQSKFNMQLAQGDCVRAQNIRFQTGSCSVKFLEYVLPILSEELKSNPFVAADKSYYENWLNRIGWKYNFPTSGLTK